MARKTKKKPLMMGAAGLVARALLRKRIVQREADRAAAQTTKNRSIAPVKAGKAAVDAALYHALGGKASEESLKKEGAKKALRKADVTADSAAVIHRKKRGVFRRFLRLQALLLGRALLKKKKRR
jgi:Arc/MetJ family transcription regulator